MDSVPTFNTRVQDLPAEPFNHVFDLTFTLPVEPGHPLEIDGSYKPPSILQVDAITRNKLAPDYYSQTKFECKSENLLSNWLCSLPRAHSDVLEKVRLHVQSEQYLLPANFERRAAKETWTRVQDQCGQRYLSLHGCEFIEV